MTLAERYRSFLFDLDGVLYRGDRPVAGAAEAVRRLRGAHRGLAFVTNNSSRTPEQIVEVLSSFGITATPQEVVTSAIATAELLAHRGGETAFVIGEDGIRTALRGAGIEVLDGEPESVRWVVVGWDRGADYAKLRTASLLVQRGATLVATNADAAYPAPDGSWPGAGALLAAVTTTTGTKAEVVGKPHAPLFATALDRAGGGPALFVGDRVDTDVAGAAGLGLDTLLVFTGVSTPVDLLGAATLPTFVGRDLTALFDEHPRVRPATAADRARVEKLLAQASLEDTPDSSGATLVADLEPDVVGTVSVDTAGDTALLRSLAVDPGSRGRFLGSLLVAHALRYVSRDGVREVYLATETAEGFFARLGFERIGSLGSMPSAFRGQTTACSQTAATMRRSL